LSRAIECTAEALLDVKDCEVCLCGAYSAKAFTGASEYTNESKSLPRSRLSSPSLRARLGGCASDAFQKTANKWAQKKGTGFLRRLADKTITLTDANKDLISPKDLRTAQIYNAQYLGVPSWLRHSAGHLKFVSTVHDLIPIKFPHALPTEIIKPFFESIDGIDPRDHVICVSEHTKMDLCEYRRDLDPARVSVAYLGASDSFKPSSDPEIQAHVRAKYSIPSGPFLLAVGTLAPHKNFARLIESFGALIQEQHIGDLNLVISGSSGWKNEQMQEALSRRKFLAQRIVFTGFVSDADLPGLYGSALAFVFPSIYEGFGLPVLEAMQCGVPVVCTNTSSVPEVAGDAALYFDPLSADEISNAMLTIYRDGILRKSLAEKAIKRAATFNWNRCASQTVASYKQALDE
ncbi:MAG: glycosyltransferase family 1 protein, partial [Opitutaceae bacterium]